MSRADLRWILILASVIALGGCVMYDVVSTPYAPTLESTGN